MEDKICSLMFPRMIYCYILSVFAQFNKSFYILFPTHKENWSDTLRAKLAPLYLSLVKCKTNVQIKLRPRGSPGSSLTLFSIRPSPPCSRFCLSCQPSEQSQTFLLYICYHIFSFKGKEQKIIKF